MKSPYFIYGERKRSRPEPDAPARAARALVALPPLPSIAGAEMVTASHPDYAELNVLHNKRNYAQPPAPPALRIMCTSTAAARRQLGAQSTSGKISLHPFLTSFAKKIQFAR